MTNPSRPQYPWPFPEPITAPDAQSADTAWDETELANKREWKATFEDLFNGAGSLLYPARAERLAGYGYTPRALRQACSNPRAMAALSDLADQPESALEANAALAHEVALYYSAGYGVAREVELDCARRLHSGGWSQPQVAALLGVTKQRMSKLLKQKRTTFGPFPGLAARIEVGRPDND